VFLNKSFWPRMNGMCLWSQLLGGWGRRTVLVQEFKVSLGNSKALSQKKKKRSFCVYLFLPVGAVRLNFLLKWCG
jgi:hypothetical protein